MIGKRSDKVIPIDSCLVFVIAAILTIGVLAWTFTAMVIV